jgi:hypothetical protein
VGDRGILETYSNYASKNTLETDIFPHEPKSLLTSVFTEKKFQYYIEEIFIIIIIATISPPVIPLIVLVCE